MKPIDILDALSDLPEEYTAFAVRSETAQTASEVQSKTSTSQGGIVMNKNQKVKIGKSNFRITRFGIAAAVAVCIGLNAALISGISRMKQNSGTFAPAAAPEIDVQHPQYMELVDAMPTGIMVKIKNDSEDDLAYNPQYIVMQDGNKVADTELPPEFEYVPSPIQPGVCGQQLSFAQLPAGRYTLVNLAEDGESEGVLGHIDFEISADFDSMVWIPDVRKMNYDEAKALLEEKGVDVTKRGSVYNGDEYAVNDVIMMEVPAYKTEKDQNGIEYGCFHYDGKGYWINTSDTVSLMINIGSDGDPATVPYVVGKGFDFAKNELLFRGYHVDKRSAYYDDVPAGCVAEETVADKAVPEEGVEAPVGSYVRITVSLGRKSDAAAQDSNTDTASAETVTVPDFTGMDWETAKQAAKDAGFLPSKMLCEPDGKQPGTVTNQIPPAGEDMLQGTVLRIYVAKKDGEQDLTMKFSVTEPHEGCYYFCVRNEAQEIIGITFPYKMNMETGYMTDYLYPDCTEENTKVEAFLVNYETKQEALIGSYILHPETATYDTITEDIEAAFRQVE